MGILMTLGNFLVLAVCVFLALLTLDDAITQTNPWRKLVMFALVSAWMVGLGMLAFAMFSQH
jgi:energy-converting hydrogenase Eha subunit C